LDDNLEHITSFILGKGEMLMWKKEKVECEADDLLSAKAFYYGDEDDNIRRSV
jgi:hypothetical protein